MRPRFLFQLAFLTLLASGFFAFGQGAPAPLKKFVDLAAGYQDSIILGQEYQAQKDMLFIDGGKLSRLFHVKLYDHNNWVIRNTSEGVEFALGLNDRYGFSVQKEKSGKWKKLAIGAAPLPPEWMKGAMPAYDLTNPLVTFGETSLLDNFKYAENIENLSHVQGDLNDLQFNFYDSRFKEKGYGPVQVHVQFYEKPFYNLVLFEKILKNYQPEFSVTSYRSVQLSESGALEKITVTEEFKKLVTGKVDQRYHYLLNDFKPAEKLNDNFLPFYGIEEPAHLAWKKPWYLSIWTLSGALLTMVGMLGIWRPWKRG